MQLPLCASLAYPFAAKSNRLPPIRQDQRYILEAHFPFWAKASEPVIGRSRGMKEWPCSVKRPEGLEAATLNYQVK